MKISKMIQKNYGIVEVSDKITSLETKINTDLPIKVENGEIIDNEGNILNKNFSPIF